MQKGYPQPNTHNSGHHVPAPSPDFPGGDIHPTLIKLSSKAFSASLPPEIVTSNLLATDAQSVSIPVLVADIIIGRVLVLRTGYLRAYFENRQAE